MADFEEKQKRHFLLPNSVKAEPFTSPRRVVIGGGIPNRDRKTHGGNLLVQIQQLSPTLEQAKADQQRAGQEEGFGLQIEFQSFSEVELALESLDRESSGIELRNVRRDEQHTYATVFVPEGKLAVFEKLITDYLDESKDGKSGPKNCKLLNAIAKIRAATLEALWTDDIDSLPQSDEEELWWEVWLPVSGDRAAAVAHFRQIATGLNFRLSPGELAFPERTVLLAYGSAGQMKRSVMALNSIAELRRAKETADFFDSLTPEEQSAWLDELRGRLTIPNPADDVPHVCVFDTGINHGHPLISLALDDVDRHSVEPAWGLDDLEGHGTEMAGLALLGNISDALADNSLLTIKHRLESVKVIPEDGANGGDARHHGLLTIEAVARPEITAPLRKRVFSMAITAKDNRDRGRPSAWSSAIDRLAADVDGQAESPRLFVLSAGNVKEPAAWARYPHSNSTDAIHDPAQAWNALTVGACTELVSITEPNTAAYQPIAPEGGLSPFSTTSQTWQSHWPLKPEVVFEGGNAANDGLSAVSMSSLSLLTTSSESTHRLFTNTNATSAASALASRMAAQLMAEYPELWPETIRGLIVHSAKWTNSMRKMHLPAKGQPTKAQVVSLIRHCGFGIPDLEAALWSVENSLTMVCESRLHPFKRDAKEDPKVRDMNLHQLPWPLEELEALGETPVEMRVTLSYFIEPNPSARGVASRYRYESHGLRFDVKRASESSTDFRARINAAARDEEEQTRNDGSDPNWMIGKQNRHKGSLHSDIWRGNAVDLASRGLIGVYPALGWWKTRPALERYNQMCRYALIVSISAPGIDVDLYSAVAAKIRIPIVVS